MAGIYIHIPFCRHKCYYCNFYSVGSLRYKDDFVNALLREIELQKDYLLNEEIETIYLGGGTPSLLTAEDLKRIFDKLYSKFKIVNNPEITFEANPDDIDDNKINDLKLTPFNRLSLGVQSFFDDDLHYLNRRHSAQQAKNAILALQDGGYRNLSIDFIYGIPGLTEKKLERNLENAIALEIPHISAYSLTVEPLTPLEKLISKGKALPTDDEQSAEHFRLTMNILEKAGYRHYEISNFYREGMESKHNSNYWTGKKYLGLGPSAHSFNIVTRQWNTSNIKLYMTSIEKNNIPMEIEILTDMQKYNEYILLSIRTSGGCDLNHIKAEFGEDKYEAFLINAEKYFKYGMIEQQDNIILLTQQGKLFADHITSELFFTI